LSKLPVDFVLVNILSGFMIGNDDQEHIIGAKTDSVEIEDFFFLAYHVSVQVTTWLLSLEYWLKEKLSFFIFYHRMELPYTHTSNFYIVLILHSSLSYLGLILFNSVVNLSAELRVLI